MTRTTAILLFISLTLPLAVAQETSTAPVVQIIVTHQSFMPAMPWQKDNPRTRVGYGILVDKNRILTTEHLIRNALVLEVRHPRSARSFSAEVMTSDYQVDLALLKSEDAFAVDADQIALSAPPKMNTPVKLYQLDETLDVQDGGATLLRTRMAPLPSAPAQVLTTDLLTEMAIDGEGAPVFKGAELAGIIISYSPGERIAQMVCTTTISRFLEDVSSPPYLGVASAGFSWKPLVDPTKRRYLGIPNRDDGILILSTMPGTSAEATLKPNDVLLGWDTHRIDSMGFYDDPGFGRMSFPFLVAGRGRADDTIPIQIIRDGRPMTIELTLGRRQDHDALIPENVTEAPVEYLVSGGMLLRELTGRYIKSHGTSWPRRLGSQIAHMYQTRRQAPAYPGEKVVILVGVLPDPVNIGYQSFHNLIVTHVNEEPVASMQDVFHAYDTASGLRSLQLRNIDTPITLDPDAVSEADQRLSRAYRIQSMSFRRTTPAEATTE